MSNYTDLNISDKVKVLREDTNITSSVIEDKINMSNQIMESDPNIVIIPDFRNDNEPDYTIDELEEMYNKYMMLPDTYRRISKGYSLSIWHHTVQQMYHRMKSKLLGDDYNKLEPEIVDKVLYQYEEEVEECADNGDFLEYQKRKLESLSQSSIYESVVTESIIEDHPYNKDYNYDNDIPSITPFLTYEEYCNVNGEDSILNPIDYITIKDQKKYYQVIHDLQNMIGTDKESIAIEQLLKLGWNPMVEFSHENIKYAREKQIKWLNERYQLDFINLSNYNTNIEEKSELDLEDEVTLEPVYIVLSYSGTFFGKIINKWTNSSYSHAGISLSATLSEIYSFNIYPEKHENGLVIESLDDYNDKSGNANILVMAIFVNPIIKKRLEKNLKWYMMNQKSTKYSIKNIVRIVFNRENNSSYSLQMVCSQFVDMILKMSNINITNKPSNLVSPGDLFKSTDRANIFILFEGKKRNYDFRKIEQNVLSLQKNLQLDQLNVVKPDIVIRKVNDNLIENFNLDCENKEYSTILKEMRNYSMIKPSIVFNEFKLPIRFTEKGSIYISAPEDLELEYNEAHKLLYSYNETNIQGIKHELARLFYINSILEKKIKKMKSTDPNKNKLVELRAKVLNDFYTYMKIVTSIEKEFDFSEYLKSTDYYNKAVEIDNSTLKYSGKYIEQAVKIIMKELQKK